MFEYMLMGDKPLDKKVCVNGDGDSLNSLNFCIFLKGLWQLTYQPLTKLYNFYYGHTKVRWVMAFYVINLVKEGYFI